MQNYCFREASICQRDLNLEVYPHRLSQHEECLLHNYYFFFIIIIIIVIIIIVIIIINTLFEIGKF